jgi:hypothetical protein
MSALRKKGSKKSGTILHAVPENATYETLPNLYQGDTTTHADQTRSATNSPLVPSRRNSNASVRTSVKPRSMEELKSALGSPALKGAIGVYKNGTVQWREKDRNTLERIISGKSSKPKIQVVIPGGIRDRPLPALPFFADPSRSHIITASIGYDHLHDVSPPSAGTKGVMRDSVVSPLNQQTPISNRQTPVSNQQTPVSFNQFQRSMSRVVRRATQRSIKHKEKISVSSGSSNDSHESDSGSSYSDHSSDTSVEAEVPSALMKARKHAHHISILNPISAGVFDASPEAYRTEILSPSRTPPRRYAHHPPIEQDQAFRPTCESHLPRSNSTTLSRKPTLTRRPSTYNKGQRIIASTSGVINQAISRSTSKQLSKRGPSPTLSEAENDLEEHLTFISEEIPPTETIDLNGQEFTDDGPFQWDEVLWADSPTVTSDCITPPPLVPRRSSKRQSAVQSETLRAPSVSRDSALQMNRGRSLRRSQALTIVIPEYKRITEDSAQTLVVVPPEVMKRNITPGNAEGVILNIFRSLHHFDDLFATAVLNYGFYRVFKRHELDLIKSTLRMMSPPAWEFREIAYPGHDTLHDEDLEMTRPQEEYTTASYLQLLKRDINSIRSIKILIREKCQSFVRPEISIALLSDDPAQAGRVDNALWRIWTFCKIFGSGKDREEDIMAQQDWLRGGVLVHQQACTFSVMNTDYMNDTFVGAPECFAKGNEGGLTAEQLFDMMEIWNCLGVLLQGFEGRTALAREYGIYDNTDIGGGDIDGEEQMLGKISISHVHGTILTRVDEWCYYLLTFGLSTILELAIPCQQLTATPFKVAAENGWNSWKPPALGGTRRNFLKEAASRVYEDKIARTYSTSSARDIQRQVSKQRMQDHIVELRQRKANGTTRMPMISMSQERPMSEWSTVIGNLTRPRPAPAADNDIVSHIPTLRSALAQDLSASITEHSPPPNARSFSPPRRTVAVPLLPTPPPSTVPSTRDRSSVAMSMPAIEEHPNYTSQIVNYGRTVAQPLLPTPPPSTVPSTRDRSSVAMNMPSIEEHPAHSRREQEAVPAVPSLLDHPAFRAQASNQAGTEVPNFASHNRQGSNQSAPSESSSEQSVFQQHQTQRSIYNSEAHENTAEKAIYRVVEMGFTAEQAREALRVTDLGDGLRVDRAVEYLLSRMAKF